LRLLDEEYTGIDDGLFYFGNDPQEAFGLIVGAEPHNPLDARAIVPTTIKDDDFSSRRKVGEISLNIHLRFLSLSWRRQSDDAEDARTYSGRYGFYRSAFTCSIAPLEYDADLLFLVANPFLQLDELNVEPLKLALVFLAFEFCFFIARRFVLKMSASAFSVLHLLPQPIGLSQPPPILAHKNRARKISKDLHNKIQYCIAADVTAIWCEDVDAERPIGANIAREVL
jgi:hypothetical protein